MNKFLKKILSPFRKTFYKCAFSDSAWGILFNPFYFARAALFRSIKELGGTITGKVLDIGSGTQPYKQLLATSEYVSLEYDTQENRAAKKADFFYDGTRFPFSAETFDAILCTQVLEHVFTPDDFLEEINRVLRADGKILLTVPFMWNEHEQPYDFARYSSFGIKELLQRHGFAILEQRKTCENVSCLFQMWNAFLHKKIAGKGSSALRFVLLLSLSSCSNIAGVFFSKMLPSNEELYLDNIVLAQKTHRRQ